MILEEQTPTEVTTSTLGRSARLSVVPVRSDVHRSSLHLFVMGPLVVYWISRVT